MATHVKCPTSSSLVSHFHRRVPALWSRRVWAGNAMTTPTSWTAVNQLVAQLKEQQGIDEHPDPANGPAHPDIHERRFGKPESAIRVKLYRDHAAWCPYCQRVWMLLEEKKIPFKMEKINMRSYGDKPQSFLSKVPGGLLPVIELDGKVITESLDIMMILEEGQRAELHAQAFPEHPMLPPSTPVQPILSAFGSAVRGATAVLPGSSRLEFDEVKLLPEEARMREAAIALMRLERDIFALWCRWLFRPADDAGEQRGREAFEAGLTAVDDALAKIGGGGPFFLGKELSMVDLLFVPFMERQNASLLYWKGFKLRNGGWANIDRWFEAMEERDSYKASQSDHYTHCFDIPPQYGTCWPAPGSEHIAMALNGKDNKSWKLPLPPLNSTSLEPRSNCEDSEAMIYRVQAAAKLAGNHEAVARFALRAVGSAGKHFTAPLADPYAKPDLEYEEAMNYALACTADALLQGPETTQQSVGDGAWLGKDNAERARAAAAVIASLEYLRDRVGVPRDMQLPAARQFRAHLNLVIDTIKDVQGLSVEPAQP